ncbi:Plasmid encoded RepA protein, partial [mine drainage metagenome]
MLWPTTVQFSQRYFESPMKHAVPLNETAIARLSHNAMGLDI